VEDGDNGGGTDGVAGDERRTFRVLLHMVGHLLNVSGGKGSVICRAVGGAVDVKKVGEMGRPMDLAEMKRELKGVEFGLLV
jgi:hypothetical protein